MLYINSDFITLENAVGNILSEEYGNCVLFTIICNDDFSEVSKREIDKVTKNLNNVRIVKQKFSTASEAYNFALKTSKANYIYFCDKNLKKLREDIAKLTLDYAKYFNSDVICFGIQTNTEASQLFFTESISRSKYARKAIFKSAIRKNLLELICNKIYKIKFLTANKILFENNGNFEIAKLKFNIDIFLVAQEIQSLATSLAYFDKIDDIYKSINLELIDEYFKCFESLFEKFEEKSIFLNIILNITGRLFARSKEEKLKNHVFSALQTLILKDKFSNLLSNTDDETAFIDYFNSHSYTDIYKRNRQNRLMFYFENLPLFHIAEDINCINEAIIWLMRFVYNKNNKNKIGVSYLKKTIGKLSKEELREYNFVVAHNLRDYIANNNLSDSINKLGKLFEEGNNELDFEILNLTGLLIYMNGDLFSSIRIFNSLMISKFNTCNCIPKCFLDITRFNCVQEYSILSLFLTNKNWLKLWNSGDVRNINKLVEEVKKINNFCSRNIILARICLTLDSYDDAAYFYKEAISYIRNDSKYPIFEAIEEFEEAKRDDLVSMIKELQKT